MTAFEPLTDPRNGVVSPGGRIVGCPQVVVDGFLVADHLREVLLDPESERYHIIPDTLRQEFIFRIFQFLCLGGQWCQYEDDIQPYLDTTKMLYKDLVRVRKDAATDEVCVTSVVLRVAAKDSRGLAFYPRNPGHVQNFAYLVVDPVRRRVTAFHHQFEGPFHS
ncbi:cilia- and flagella-associated protein 300-like [Bacillus rossius redtenbacheri]|uniref:cilia- and flagella-associated protein 300-like n=1 Tax=Bacillus rossius redtenbacheri TaxID=93214 RepID=UPI002FDC854E